MSIVEGNRIFTIGFRILLIKPYTLFSAKYRVFFVVPVYDVPAFNEREALRVGVEAKESMINDFTKEYTLRSFI